MHCRRGHGDVAHLAAWPGRALAIQVDAGIGDGKGALGSLEVRVGGCAADEIEHDGWLAEFEALRGNGEIEDGAEVRVELRQCAALHRVVARVVDSAGDLAQEKAVVFEEEHLHAKRTLPVKRGNRFAREGLRSLVDVVGDVARRCVGDFAYRVLLDGLDGGVG